MLFHRRNYTQMWLVMTANEPLKLLSGGYVLNYDGIPSQITLQNAVSANDRHDILVTNDNPQMVKGYLDLSTIPNGYYLIEGFVSDLIGNGLIIGAVGFTVPPNSVTSTTILYIRSGGGFDINLPIINFYNYQPSYHPEITISTFINAVIEHPIVASKDVSFPAINFFSYNPQLSAVLPVVSNINTNIEAPLLNFNIELIKEIDE